MNSPTITPYTTMGVGKGGVEGGLDPSLHFEIFLFNFSKKGCLISFEWEK